jgi:hypothetical protein
MDAKMGIMIERKIKGEYVNLINRETDEEILLALDEALERDDLDDMMIGRIEGVLSGEDFTWVNGYSDRWDTRQALEAFALIIKLSTLTSFGAECFKWNKGEVTYDPYESHGIEEDEEGEDFIKACDKMDEVAHETDGDFDEYRKLYTWNV